MPPKKATIGKSTVTDTSGRGVTTRSQDLRRAADADAAPLEREGMPPPPSSSHGNGLRGAEAGNHGLDGAVEGGVELGAPSMPPPPSRPHAGLPAACSPHPNGGADECCTLSASRRSVSGLPGVHNRNDALAMVRSLLDFPLTPDSP